MNNNIFSADLSTLTLNNNCLVKTINNTQNVMRIPYVINFTTDNAKNSYTIYPNTDSIFGDIKQETDDEKRTIPALMASCNSLPNCRGFNDGGWIKDVVKNKLDSGTGTLYIRNGIPTLGSSTFQNTLNINNANTGNTLIFSYIFIPTTQYYKFRVTSTNSAYTENGVYKKPCRIYLNSFQTVILDSYIQNNETRYEVIKKGTYLICIDVPQTDAANPTANVPVSFEYMAQNIGTTHPERALNASWITLNNLLITNCDTLLTSSNAWTLVDLFLNSANEYCKKDNNIISTACKDYYTNIPNYITKSLNEKHLLSNKSIYPDSINGEYGDWSISDTDWSKDVKNLSTEYKSCGKSAQRTKTRTYYPPRYGGNENKQSPHTSDTQTKDVNCHTDTYVNTEWTNRSCNATIPPAIRDAQFNSDITTLKTELDKYNKATLISGLSSDNSKLNTCYTDWNGKSVSSFTLVGGDETNVPYKSVIYSNVCYMNNYKWTHTDTTNVLTMQTDGNLVLSTSNGTVLWSTNTSGNTNARLCVLRTGKLVIYKSDGTELWSYDVNNTIFSTTDGMWYELSNINTIKAMKDLTTVVYGNDSNRLCSNLFYSNGYTISSLNNKFKLQIKPNGAFYLYPSTNVNDVLWDSLTGDKPSARVVLQADGNLVMIPSNETTTILWKSDTHGNNGAYCELTNFGLILIRSKSNNSIIKCINQLNKDRVEKHKNITSTLVDKVFSSGWEKCFTTTELMYPELVYRNNFQWTNGDYKLTIEDNGNLKTDDNNGQIGATYTSGNPNGFCWLKNDGKLETHREINSDGNSGGVTQVVSGATYSNFAYLKLTNKGFCLFLNTSDQIVNVSSKLNGAVDGKIAELRRNIRNAAQTWYRNNYYNDSKEGIPNLKANIKSYLKDTHWNKSPDWMFCRKGGQFFKLNANLMSSILSLSGDTYKLNDKAGKYSTIAAGFRGWYVSQDNDLWKVTRRNLKHVDGYDNQLDTSGTNSNDTSNNYSDSSEWTNWEGDKKQIRKASELRNGIEKPNYLPGYVRLSGNDYDQTKPQNSLYNVGLEIKYPSGGFLISERCGTCKNLAYPIFLKIRNKDTYANDIWDNHPELIENIINDRMSHIFDTGGLFHTNLVNDRFGAFVDDLGHDRKWTDNPWKNNIIETSSIRSAFTNKKIIPYKKSNFLSKINNALPYNTQGKIVENFINPICNLTNILKDPACSGSEYDTYKQYLTTMDTYCSKNPLKPVCSSYITKEIVSIEDPTNIVKINEENKIKILTKQENLCTDEFNYLDPRCITINSKKPEIIQKQIKELDKESSLYKQLAANYGEEINYQTCIMSTNMLDKDKDMCKQLELNSVNYGSRLKSKRLEICKQDSNIFHKECIELNKREQFPVITEYCAKDTNLLQKECLDFNKEYKLSEIKQQCKDNKTNNCKQLCKEYNEDFKDICFWENNQIYFILVFIALIIIGGVIGYFKFKGRKVINTQTQPNTVYTQPGMLLNTTVLPTSPVQYQVAAIPQQDQAVEQIPIATQPMNNTQF